MKAREHALRLYAVFVSIMIILAAIIAAWGDRASAGCDYIIAKMERAENEVAFRYTVNLNSIQTKEILDAITRMHDRDLFIDDSYSRIQIENEKLIEDQKTVEFLRAQMEEACSKSESLSSLVPPIQAMLLLALTWFLFWLARPASLNHADDME